MIHHTSNRNMLTLNLREIIVHLITSFNMNIMQISNVVYKFKLANIVKSGVVHRL